MAQLLRDNAADSRVVDDLTTLAAAYDDDGVAASTAATEEAFANDMAILAEAFAEPSAREPWWRESTAQVLQYRWWVATAVAIILVILFVHPAPLTVGTDEAGTALIPTADAQHAAATVPSVVPQVSVDDPFDFSIASPEPTFDTSDGPSAFDTTPVTYEAPPTALRISQSGYASTLAGTPADQTPPANGLPAESLAGQVTKYSFIRLVGGGASLKLKALTDDGASLNAAEARVDLCHITTANWKAARDVSSSDAPKYNNAQCLEGHLASGVWTFTFSAVFNPVDPNGWAIVPVTTDNGTFRVTFAPTAAA